MDNWPGMEDDPDAQARIKKACEMLECDPYMNVLDLGCHKQEARGYLPGKCFYIGIDQQALVSGTIVMDFDGEFEYPEKVERVLCLEVLEHLKYPGETLQSISQILEDDGIAVVSLPNEASLFHRLRCLLGVVDQECFSSCGKHLHLPSLGQCREFLSKIFSIEEEDYYISKEARGTRQPILQLILKILPNPLYMLLANCLPSLFARGFIFKLKKRLP